MRTAVVSSAFIIAFACAPSAQGQDAPTPDVQVGSEVGEEVGEEAGPLDTEQALRADGRPAPLKVIVRRKTSLRLSPAPDAPVRREVGPMEFFFVLPSDTPGWHRVATREVVSAGTQLGYLAVEDVVEWWHREAIGLLPRASGRQRARFYEDATGWQDGFTRWPAAAEQDQGALGIEPERLGNAGFVMPVLEAREGVTLDLDGSVHDLYRVAFIAALASDPVPAPSAPVAPEPALRAELGAFLVDVVFCVDVSGSMQPYIDAVREAIARVTADLREKHPGLSDRFRFGLVTFRGPGEAEVACRLADGRDHARFLASVAALDDEGGAGEGEDVISGMKLALGMDWCEVGFKQIVLVGDEAAFGPDNHPERNPSGLTIEELLTMAQPIEGAVRPLDALRVCRVISTVEVQRPVNGEALDQLRTRQFSELAGLGDGAQFPGEAFRFGADQVTGMRDALVADLTRRIEGARAVAELVDEEAPAPLPATRVDDDPRFAGVPAPFREMIELLRPAAGEALPVRDAWVSSFDAYGAAVVTERFLVSRARLRRLQQVIELVGTELDQPGVNPGVLVQMLQQRLAAMSIDHDLSPTTPLSVVFEIVGGLPIRTPLMELSPEQVAAMTPADRGRVVDKLARMARAFDEQLETPGLWFKLDPSDDARDALAFIAIDDVR